eukprot:Hpha_TRINITY_DN7487_c0_g1::TRINITY_DN7487_c0_g1_i1::g.96028::m.96028
MTALPPWSADKGLEGWTMKGTDVDVDRALRRQFAAFEDERSRLLRTLRQAEGAADDAKAQLADAEARIADLEAEVESLSEQLMADDGDEDKDAAELAEAQERIAELEAEAEFLRQRTTSRVDPASGLGGSGLKEEVEFLREQLNEAERGQSTAEAELKRLRQELESARKVGAAGAGNAAEAQHLRLELSSAQRERDTTRDALAALKKELVASKQETAQARQAEIEQRQRAEALDRDLMKTVAARGAAQQGHQEELRALQRRVSSLELELKDARQGQQRDPASPEVRQHAEVKAEATARKMKGQYQADYQVLFDQFYNFEREIQRLKNELLSLQTIIKMREQDVEQELRREFDRERNDLLSRITALEMR